MFNHPALDIAIGLVFIYLLYSLLTTALKEFIATIFDYRPKMLQRGIEQMLDGKNIKMRWWNRIFDWIAKTGGKNTRRNKKEALFANYIFSHALYKNSSDNSGWFSSGKPSYIDPSVFSDIFIDVIAGPGKESVMKTIQANVEKLGEGDLKKILLLYVQEANGDLQRFKILIDAWFITSMHRVSGWYKKQANWIVFFLGLCLSFAFNVSTIEIVSKLSKDKVAREALVKNASEYVSKNSDAKFTTDTAGGKTDTATVKERLQAIKDFYKASIEENNNVMGLGWGDFGGAGADSGLCGLGKKILYVLKESISSPRKWIGFLITAFAISMGAPFWFDLLNKFVNLRVSGQRPAGMDVKKQTTRTVILSAKPDPDAIA
jgi:hypothetical protein